MIFKYLKKPIHLIIPYYFEPNLQRQSEINYTINKNIGKTWIESVTIVNEQGSELANGLFKDTEKICFISVNSRPTFNTMFSFFKEDKINILLNNDIELVSLPFSVRIAISCFSDLVFCLTRWEKNRSIFRANEGDSQDCWIKFGTLKIKNSAGQFFMGVMGCDNKIAYELKASNYIVLNPSRIVKTLHHHESGIRNYSSIKDLQRPDVILNPIGYRYLIYYLVLKYLSLNRISKTRY